VSFPTAEACIQTEDATGVVATITTICGEESIGEPEDETDDTNADETAGSAPDAGVEEITGIGPTYAQRLRAAGIETVGDLAGADLETVADATNAAESRVDDWIAQARGD